MTRTAWLNIGVVLLVAAVVWAKDPQRQTVAKAPGAAKSAVTKTEEPTENAATQDLDPHQPYQAKRYNPVSYDVDFSVVVTPPYGSRVLKVWLPLPQSDLGQEVTEGRLTSFPVEITPQIGTEPTFGNRFAYFEFDQPEGAQVIRHQFKIKVFELHWNLDPNKVVKVTEWPSSFDCYLQSDKAVVVDYRLAQILQDIVKESKGGAGDLQQIMLWVNKTMKYDHAKASLQASSEHALLTNAGHCSDYHGLCAAMGRTLNYPSRVTYGINPTPKNSPSHCKFEAFLPPYGWVSFDVSETQLLIAKINADSKLSTEQKKKLSQAANDRLFSGFRDNTWFIQTRGTGYDLVPPAAEKVNIVRTAYVEADGQRLPEPDPADATKREFAWMTVHKYTPDKAVKNPFKEISSLETN